MAAGRSQSSRDLAGADIVAGRQESPVAQESVTGEPLVIMSVELNEWVNLFLRWVHVFAGILRVGTTYYFTWLDGRFTELDRKLSKSSPDPQPRPDPNAVHSSTSPSLQHSSAPPLQHSSTPPLQHSSTPGLPRVWMVHSGGFYVVEKQRVPEAMPEKLHWFRWEAAITWLTGILMLILVYYHGGL